MLMRSLISLLFLGASGCSVSTLSQASQPAASSTNFSTQTLTPGARGVSKQLVSVKAKNLRQSLDSYQWKNRLLLVFAPSENNGEYQQQMQLLQGQTASFAERNLLTIELLTEGTNSDDAQVAKIRERFNVSPQEFSVILVGKDGAAKRREQSPVSAQSIFATIDAMPMRQQEMRRSSN